jgi:hypothetical protein
MALEAVAVALNALGTASAALGWVQIQQLKRSSYTIASMMAFAVDGYVFGLNLLF